MSLKKKKVSVISDNLFATLFDDPSILYDISIDFSGTHVFPFYPFIIMTLEEQASGPVLLAEKKYKAFCWSQIGWEKKNEYTVSQMQSYHGYWFKVRALKVTPRSQLKIHIV